MEGYALRDRLSRLAQTLRWHLPQGVVIFAFLLLFSPGTVAASQSGDAGSEPPGVEQLSVLELRALFTVGWSSESASSFWAAAWGDYDNDGDLDLAVGAPYSAIRLFRNDTGTLTRSPVWASSDVAYANSLAWGDCDGDGDLDLAVGNGLSDAGKANSLYRNEGGTLSATAVWLSADADVTMSVAWGDFDGDGDLDLAAGNQGAPDKVYANVGGMLNPSPVWSSGDIDITNSVAWGDYDNDGDLDLATGNGTTGTWQKVKVYPNQAQKLGSTPAWSSYDSAATQSVAWGDYDNDGDLDLITGGTLQSVRLYQNNNGALGVYVAWQSSEIDQTMSVAWGDSDRDGDLDLATGNGNAVRLYQNDAGSLTTSAIWSSPEEDLTHVVSWGDYDNDGDLDLATAANTISRVYRNEKGVMDSGSSWSALQVNWDYGSAWGDYDRDGDLDLVVAAGQSAGEGFVRLYPNEAGHLGATTVWQSNDHDPPRSVAWGDYDRDGDLDLAVGNDGFVDRVYKNNGGALSTTAGWTSSAADYTVGVAWADYDGDLDLDLVTTSWTDPVRLYRNDGGSLGTEPIWSSAPGIGADSVAWGDFDGDGDLDLALGGAVIRGPRIYRNVNGSLSVAPVWSGSEKDRSHSVAWVDYDGDGDLDLSTGNFGQNYLYRNDDGQLSASAVWRSVEADWTTSMAWGDFDQDGDVDQAVGNHSGASRLYCNEAGTLTDRAVWSSDEQQVFSVAWGDYDLDGDLDLFSAGAQSMALHQNRRSTPLSLRVPGSRLWSAVRLSRPVPPANADFYSAADIWPAFGSTIALQYTLSQPDSRRIAYIRAYYSVNGGGKWLPAVAASGTITTDLATSPTGITYTYNWDVFASGFFGQSDNVVFRIVAVPDLHPVKNSVPGPFLFGSNASATFPFRVRGTQVRVMENGQAVKDALVYRQPAGSTEAGQVITSLSGEPFKTDSQGYLQGRGTINVGDRLFALAPITATAAYTLYHTSALPTATGLDGFTVTAPGVQTLNVSASHPLLLFNLDVSLEWDARNDTQFLAQLNYDLQRASEFLYDWSNGQAALGKLTVHHNRELWQDAHIRIYATNRLRPSAVQGGVVTQPYTETLPSNTIVYYPGQLYMGATWNRYGNAGSSLDEDWPRTLAHELGHYVLYLQDNYLGKDAQGQIVPVDGCAGAMADPYRDDAAAGYGEFHFAADWLPACENTLSHLDTERADWDTITEFYPQLDGVTTNSGPATLPLAVTDIRYVVPAGAPLTLKAPIFFLAQDGQRVQPGSTARAFLYRGGWATDLGRPTLDQLLARGAELGDRVCLYESAAHRLGCESVTLGDEQLALVSRPEWQPDIQVSPVTSRTLTLDVAGVPAGLSLKARLYPLDTAAGDPIGLVAQSGVYSGNFNSVNPTFQGYVQVWVDEPEPRREAIIDFTLGGNPGHQRSGGGHQRSGGGHQRSGGAPVMSADGQVILFAPDVELEAEWFYTLQATTAAVQPPPWATLVGQAYRLSATADAPDLAGTSLSFSYLGSEVPPGEEEWLKLYFHDGTEWQQLATALDMYHNLASAPTQGPGIYALMSSIEVGIDAAGWNFIAYPVRATRPVTEALISITGYYTTVYSYRPTDTLDPWKVYDVTVPDWVNDLETLEFGRGYWINVLEALILKLKGGTTVDVPQGRPDQAEGIPLPPATYYGRVLAGSDFAPVADLPVTAWIDGHLCGQGRTLEVGGQVMYSINVLADGSGVAVGCGAAGRQVTFQVGARKMATVAKWNISRVWELLLRPEAPERLFLPVILRNP